VAALCTWHRLHGFNIDRGPLYDILRGASAKAKPARKAKALLADGLREILVSLDPARSSDVRDGALLTLAFAAALRGSEACGLDWRRSGGLREGTCGHIELRPEGLLLVLSRSKTSQLEPQFVTVARDQWPSAIEWLERWVSLAAVQPGQRVFAPVGRGGRIGDQRLASASITPIVRGRVLSALTRKGMAETEAILEANRYASHSLRRGMLQASAKAGTAEGLLRSRARHKSAETTAGYVELEASWMTDWGVRL
jgi:integrase